jgi:acyl transferase domain-containing protein
MDASQQSLSSPDNIEIDAEASRNSTVERIAIIAAACRLLVKKDLSAFCALLFDGQEAIVLIVDVRLSLIVESIDRVGSISEVDQFDPIFFGIAQREAKQMNPPQRLLMELEIEALESAGLPRAAIAGSRTGVYIVIVTADYTRLQLAGSAG